KEILRPHLDDGRASRVPRLVRLDARHVPDAALTGQRRGEGRSAGAHPSDDLHHLAGPRAGDRRASVFLQLPVRHPAILVPSPDGEPQSQAPASLLTMTPSGGSPSTTRSAGCLNPTENAV